MAYDVTDIGGSPKSITGGDAYGFSRVKVIDTDTGGVYEAGDGSGRTFVYKTTGGSQAKADWLLSRAAWKTFYAYDAQRAQVDAAAEAGDFVIDLTGGLGKPMYTQEINFASGYSDIGAPGYEELDGDYTYLNDMEKAVLQSSKYTDQAITSAFGEDGAALQVRIVSELPEDHAQHNILWVVPS